MGVSGDDGSVLVSVVGSRSFGLLGEGVWDLPPMNGYGGRGMMGFASFSSVHDEKRGFVFPFESPYRLVEVFFYRLVGRGGWVACDDDRIWRGASKRGQSTGWFPRQSGIVGRELLSSLMHVQWTLKMCDAFRGPVSFRLSWLIFFPSSSCRLLRQRPAPSQP